MRPITFRYGVTDGMFRAVHESLESALESTWSGLLQDASDIPPVKWWTYGPYGDEHAVWLELAWRLAAGLELTVVVWPDDDLRDRDGTPVRYGYRVDPQEPLPVRDAGLVASSDLAAFPVDRWLDLVQMRLRLRSGAYRDMTIFALAPGRRAALLDALGKGRRPELHELLQLGELLIEVVIAEDIGYANAVIVRAPEDRSEWCESVARDLNRAAKRYEHSTPYIADIDEFILAVTTMATGEAPSGAAD